MDIISRGKAGCSLRLSRRAYYYSSRAKLCAHVIHNVVSPQSVVIRNTDAMISVDQKKGSSLVLMFENPKDANTAIDYGLAWEGNLKHAKSTKELRLIQCRRCQK
jgi:hypothetical protein